MMVASVSCLTLLRQEMRLARSLALASAGNSRAARIAMIAMTTSNSIKVKPLCRTAAPDMCDGRNARELRAGVNGDTGCLR